MVAGGFPVGRIGRLLAKIKYVLAVKTERYSFEFEGKGSFGTVYKVLDRQTNKHFAIKMIKIEDKVLSKEILRECSILLDLKHPNVVRLDYVFIEGKHIGMVMEYIPMTLNIHHQIYESHYPHKVKYYIREILLGLRHCHDHGVLHRDIKPENILVDTSNVNRHHMKIADFGLARGFVSAELSPKVVTRGYRAPELLLGLTTYTSAVDIWSVACILAELVQHTPLFPAASDLDELSMILQLLGTPSGDTTWTGISKIIGFSDVYMAKDLATVLPRLEPLGLDLLSKMLIFDPSKRISAQDALQHPYLFDDRKIDD